MDGITAAYNIGISSVVAIIAVLIKQWQDKPTEEEIAKEFITKDECKTCVSIEGVISAVKDLKHDLKEDRKQMEDRLSKQISNIESKVWQMHGKGGGNE